MKIYNYNGITKEFISQTVARENPLEKGKYLIPANATIKELLAQKNGFAICFDETKKEWEYVEDNRGETIYSTETKTPQEVNYLGDIEEGFTLLEPSGFDRWNGTSWEIDNKLVEENEEKKRLENLSKAKAVGEVYTLNDVDYQVPFMKDDADGLLQVKSAFDLGVTDTVIYFTNGTKMPITSSEFMEFAVWFVNKRNSFFIGDK